tara:strand:- start:507 stop:1067 length:561 start_codon:yes stop_codon:yes gene_type:complete
MTNHILLEHVFLDTSRAILRELTFVDGEELPMPEKEVKVVKEEENPSPKDICEHESFDSHSHMSEKTNSSGNDSSLEDIMHIAQLQEANERLMRLVEAKNKDIGQVENAYTGLEAKSAKLAKIQEMFRKKRLQEKQKRKESQAPTTNDKSGKEADSDLLSEVEVRRIQFLAGLNPFDNNNQGVDNE